MKLKRKAMSVINRLSSRLLNYSLRIYNSLNKKSFTLYDPSTNLVIPKNKYLLSTRDDVLVDVVSDFVNTKDTYDFIWGNDKFIKSYESEKQELYEYVISAIRKVSNGTSKLRIIDVGCGTGGLLQKLLTEFKNATVTGVDFSDSSIKLCQERMPTGTFAVSDIFNFNIDDPKFDFVLCMEVLEHIQFVDKAIKRLQHLLDVNGRLIITIPDGVYDTWTGHINFWSQEEFCELLKNNDCLIDDSVRISDGGSGGYLIYICTHK